MSDFKLRPCPICGNQPEILTVKNNYGPGGCKTFYFVDCGLCNLSFGLQREWSDVNKLTEAWNVRITTDDLKRQLEKARLQAAECQRDRDKAYSKLSDPRAHAEALAHGLKEILYVYNQLISHGVIETPVATLRYTAKKSAENALAAYRNREE